MDRSCSFWQWNFFHVVVLVQLQWRLLCSYFQNCLFFHLYLLSSEVYLSAHHFIFQTQWSPCGLFFSVLSISLSSLRLVFVIALLCMTCLLHRLREGSCLQWQLHSGLFGSSLYSDITWTPGYRLLRTDQPDQMVQEVTARKWWQDRHHRTDKKNFTPEIFPSMKLLFLSCLLWYP